MNTLPVTLTPWARERILRDYCATKRITKKALRQSIAEFPDTEFHTIASFVSRGGAVVTCREAREQGVDMLEVRDTNQSLIAAIYLTTPVPRVS